MQEEQGLTTTSTCFEGVDIYRIVDGNVVGE
jgi:hypothetical protein